MLAFATPSGPGRPRETQRVLRGCSLSAGWVKSPAAAWLLLALLSLRCWADPTATFDWRDIDGKDYTTPARGQGFCGSCGIFAAVGEIEAKFNIDADDPDRDLDLSEQHPLCADLEDCLSSGYMETLLLCSHAGGIHDEATLPYLARDECSPDSWPPKPPYTLYRATDIVDLTQSNMSDLKAGVEAHGPVAFVMHTDEFYWPPGIPPDTSPSGWHGVCFTGFTDDADAPGGGYWHAKNSWRGSWGDGGWGYTTYEDVAPRLGHFVILALHGTYTEYVPAPKPEAPSDFTDSSAGTDAIAWSWTDNSDSEDGFRIEPVGGSVGENATSWVESGLTPNTAYTRYVVAYNADHDSDASNADTAWTLAAVPGEGVLDLAAADTIEATWLANGNPGGTLYRCECYEGDAFDPDKKVSESTWTTATRFEVTALKTNTLYTCRVQAKNGEETPTAWMTFGDEGVWTPAALPGPAEFDMEVMRDGRLSPDAPGSRSVRLKSIDGNGNPPDTQVALRVGAGPSGWLRIDPSNGCAYPDGLQPEWHTAAEWATARLCGLTPATTYVMSGMARNGAGDQTAPTELGGFTTNRACDVDRSGLATALDYAFIKIGSLHGGVVPFSCSWACDVNGDGVVDSNDLADALIQILNP